MRVTYLTGQSPTSITLGQLIFKGDKGDKGDTGDQGPQGVAGPAGGLDADDRVRIDEAIEVNTNLGAVIGDVEAARDVATGAAGTSTAQAGIALDAAGLAIVQADAAGVSAGLADQRAGDADTAAGLSNAARVAAETARTQAETYAASAGTAARFYDTIALGRAAVTDGQTFGVRAGGSDGLVDATTYRRDSATTQTPIVDLASAAVVRAERVQRVAGDERWPSLIDPVEDFRHVQVNDAGQVVGYEDAAGRQWIWDAAVGDYVPPVIIPEVDVVGAVTPLLEAEATARGQAVQGVREEALGAVSMEQGARAAGDERWPTLDDPIEGIRHVQTNDAGQIVAYEDAVGVFYRWDAANADYVVDAALIAAPLVEVERTERIAAVAEVQEGIAVGDERWPSLPLSYAGAGIRHVQMNDAGQVVAYTDNLSRDWRWDTDRSQYVQAGGQDFTPQITAISERIDSSDWWNRTRSRYIAEATTKRYGIELPDGPVTSAPSNIFIPTWSEDHASYHPFVTVGIPCIAIVGRRMWKTDYGIIGVELPMNSEHEHCYGRMMYCDMDAPGGIDPAAGNWVIAGYWLPDEHGQIKDMPIFETFDGRMAMIIPSLGVSGTPASGRALFGIILNNAAEGVNGAWDWGDITCLTPTLTQSDLTMGSHFATKIAHYGDELRVVINVFRGSEATYDPVNIHRSIICRLDVYKNTFAVSDMGTVPGVEYEAANFQECSIAPWGKGKVMAVLRTLTGPRYTINDAGGADGHWTVPTPIDFVATTAVSKFDLSLSPQGNLVLIYNRGANRRNASIAISRDGFETVLVDYLFDARNNTAVSYFNAVYGRNVDGSYNGKIYVTYDNGRGITINPETGLYIARIVIAELDENELLAGNRSAKIYVFEPDGSAVIE